MFYKPVPIIFPPGVIYPNPSSCFGTRIIGKAVQIVSIPSSSLTA